MKNLSRVQRFALALASFVLLAGSAVGVVFGVKRHHNAQKLISETVKVNAVEEQPQPARKAKKTQSQED